MAGQMAGPMAGASLIAWPAIMAGHEKNAKPKALSKSMSTNYPIGVSGKDDVDEDLCLGRGDGAGAEIGWVNLPSRICLLVCNICMQ